MTSNLPPREQKKELNKISDVDRLDMAKPEIKSRFPLVDRFLNIINCCKPVKDPVGTMLD
jgi:hypothetical protein